jgi:hypothetical protein
MLDKLLRFVSNPYVAAAAGGAASYYFIGKKKKGKEPYYWAGGGAAAGYLVGKMVQSHFAQQQAAIEAQQQATLPQGQRQQQAPGPEGSSHEEYVELDVDQVFNQAPPGEADLPPPVTPPGQVPTTEEEIANEMDRAVMDLEGSDLGSLGGLGGSPLGSNGLGSFDRPEGFDGDDPAVRQAVRDAKEEYNN